MIYIYRGTLDGDSTSSETSLEILIIFALSFGAAEIIHIQFAF